MNIDSSYISAISKTLPGTFVPDIAPGDPQTQNIPSSDAAAGTSFKDTVKGFLDDVNSKIDASDQASRDLATGRTNDVGQVVTSAEEANLAMQFTLAIRNKLLSAYNEISQMQM